jgi:hypothetical protein
MNNPYKPTEEQRDQAEETALRSIGRGWAMILPIDEHLIGATQEEIRKYEDVYHETLHSLIYPRD